MRGQRGRRGGYRRVMWSGPVGRDQRPRLVLDPDLRNSATDRQTDEPDESGS